MKEPFCSDPISFVIISDQIALVGGVQYFSTCFGNTHWYNEMVESKDSLMWEAVLCCVFLGKVSVSPLLPLQWPKMPFHPQTESINKRVWHWFTLTKSQRNTPVIWRAVPLLSTQHPARPTVAAPWPQQEQQSPAAARTSPPYPQGLPHFVNLFIAFLTDKLRQTPFLSFPLHPLFPSRAASLLLHHYSQKLLCSCSWSLPSVFLRFWSRVLGGIA